MNEALKAKQYTLRKTIITMIYKAKTGHIGGDFSVCDILNVLYNKHMNITPENFDSNDHDHFILSKGHSVEALYSVLADKAFSRQKILKHFPSICPNTSGIPIIKSRESR